MALIASKRTLKVDSQTLPGRHPATEMLYYMHVMESDEMVRILSLVLDSLRQRKKIKRQKTSLIGRVFNKKI
ncbi:hypothetical protein HNY73_005440 [Argiope bruennichi]|uniref:Uncharacterized protein n=1 Tax=Argiope bruennichi TaxID=94029 RepID=A0A8T0FGI8_ARGBR|nr:hypothetical protein HNY73_005440 [Argiope bruennichi]